MSTLQGVGPVSAGARQPGTTIAGGEEAQGAGEKAPAAPADSSALNTPGAASLIGADGRVRTGWGLVEAPPVLPTEPGRLIEMKKYGDTEMPLPRPDLAGPPVTDASPIGVPSEIRPPEPLRRNRFSITTGPPQGDP